AITAVPGVRHASVNLATGRARVRTDVAAGIGGIISAVRATGYEPQIETVPLTVDGMTCASCVGRVERALKAVPGVVDASVNLAASGATVQVPAGTVTDASLIRAIEGAGYQARRAQGGREERAERQAARADETGRLRREVILAAALTLPIVILDMGSHLVP